MLLSLLSSSCCCALCLKPISRGGGVKFRRHLILLGRLLRITSSGGASSSKEGFSSTTTYFCDDCASVLDSLLTCHDQMKGLELRVEWNLWKLQGIASLAARVPSRWASATKLYREAERLEELEAVRAWRSMFLMKCTQKLATRFPQVRLWNCRQEEDNINIKPPQEDASSTQQSIAEDAKTPFKITKKTLETRRDVGGTWTWTESDDEAPPAPPINSFPASPNVQDDDDFDDNYNQQTSSSDESRFRARHQCWSCSKTFSSVDNLKSHEKVAHLDIITKWEEGDEEEEEVVGLEDPELVDFEPKADSEEEFRTHLKMESDSDEHLSSDDDDGNKKEETSVGNPKVSSAVKLVGGEGPTFRTCGICKRRVRGAANYKRHFIQNHKIDGVESTSLKRCDVDQCSAYFLTGPQLRSHKVLEHKKPVTVRNVGKYAEFYNFEVESACKLCHRVFLTLELLSEHCKIWHIKSEVDDGGGGGSLSGGAAGGDKALFSCKVAGCSTHCPSRALLVEHMERVHQADLPPSVVPLLSAPAPGVVPPSFHGTGEELSSRTCDICQLVFKRAWNLKVHFKTNHELAGLKEGEEVKRCREGQCKAYFRTEFQLTLHMVRSHRKAKVRSNNNNNNHVQPSPEDDEEEEQVGDIEHDDEPSSDANKSNKWATKKRLYCPVCPRWFSSNQCRTDHFRKWHDLTRLAAPDSPVWSCDQPHCSAYFVARVQLDSHLNEAHAHHQQYQDPAAYTCEDCGLHFHYGWRLTEHRKRNHDDKHLLLRTQTRSSCKSSMSIDNKVRWRKYEWQVHGPVGKGKRRNKPVVEPPVCDVCGKSVRGPLSLRAHKLTHSGPNSYPFACATCGKKFVNSGMLTRHSRTHSQEKPYVCQYCGKGFAHDNLRRHIRMNHPTDADPSPPPSGRTLPSTSTSEERTN